MNEIEMLYKQACDIYGENRIVFASCIEGTDLIPSIPFVYILPLEPELYLSGTILYRHEEYIDFRTFFSNIKMFGGINNYAAIAFPQAVFNEKYKDILLNNIIYNKDKKYTFREISKMAIEETQQGEECVKKNIIKVFEQYLSLHIQFQKEPTKNQKPVKFSDTEKKVLKRSIEELHGKNQGFVSISYMTEKCRVSRPVFTSLFYKLKESNMASVTARGMKGTEIIFNNNVNINSYID